MKTCSRPVYKKINNEFVPVGCGKCFNCSSTTCEFCGNTYTDKELFEEFEITSIPGHFYCSKYCYEKDNEEQNENL